MDKHSSLHSGPDSIPNLDASLQRLVQSHKTLCLRISINDASKPEALVKLHPPFELHYNGAVIAKDMVCVTEKESIVLRGRNQAGNYMLIRIPIATEERLDAASGTVMAHVVQLFASSQEKDLEAQHNQFAKLYHIVGPCKPPF